VVALVLAALPQQQVAVLIAGDLNDVPLTNEGGAVYGLTGFFIRGRLWGGGGLAGDDVGPAYDDLRCVRWRSLWKIMRQSPEQNRC
jgi:hypothetical protein